MQHWEQRYWRDSWGVQAYTGKPSGYLTDLDFEYESISMYPEQTLDCIRRVCSLTKNPLLTITKSGGIRFTCRTPGYVHPRIKEDQEYVYQFVEYNDSGNMVRDLLLEVFGDRNLSRWDARYEIINGSIFDVPDIEISKLFGAIEPFRQDLSIPTPDTVAPIKQKTPKNTSKKSKAKPTAVGPHIKVDYGIIVEHLINDDDWLRRKDGTIKSKRGTFPCNMTQHIYSRGSVQFYMQKDGSIKAFCHNCRKGDIVTKKPKKKSEQ